MNNFDFAVALAKTEKEEDVVTLLKNLGYWDNISMWKALGDNDNNYSIIGNQQKSADAAFVEKMINSIDACLTRECLKRGLNPAGPEAPQSMSDALEQFYGIKPGGLKLLSSARRTELAQNIVVAATSQSRGGEINLCIADRGEGQTPSILVIADCTNIDVDHQEKLFMPSRDRLRDSDFTRALKGVLEKELRDHPGLKKAAHDRRTEELKNKLADDKPLKDVLQNIFSKSTVLTKLFIAGQDISSPFNTTYNAGQGDVFEGKLHPTFFILKGKFKDGKLTKTVPCNAAFRVQFDTDAENDYFTRPSEAGTLVLKMDGVVRDDLIKHLSLFNGQANLTISLPDGAVDGDKHVFETEIHNEFQFNRFENTFYVDVTKAEEHRSFICRLF